MPKSDPPRVAVLLAAFNGEKFITEQVTSILRQLGVTTDIYISIDKSNDKTSFICKNLQSLYCNIFTYEAKERFGSAGRNFYHLIKNVEFKKYDYIAFSDQDDIWKEEKLIHGIKVIKSKNAIGYSSDVECFWNNSNKKNKIIKKSNPQRKYDYYFEPAGPGCTYLIEKSFAILLKEELYKLKSPPYHHDWYIYALARSKNLIWIIDSTANVLYRQHENNQVGANQGIKQYITRIKKLRSGSFKKEHNEILNSVNIKKPTTKEIISNPFEFRRNKKESLLLILFCLIGWI